MADAEIARQFSGINVRLRCPRCRALLDISQLDARQRFLCGGCRLNTDVATCAASTEGLRLRPGLRLAMAFVPAAFAGFFFGMLQSLIATGFSFWGEAALVGLALCAACGLASMIVGQFAIAMDAQRAAARFVLAALTLGLGAWLRERAGAGAVSDTMMMVLDGIALFWLCVAIFNIFRVFRPPAAKQVAQVVEVDNLTP